MNLKNDSLIAIVCLLYTKCHEFIIIHVVKSTEEIICTVLIINKQQKQTEQKMTEAVIHDKY